METTPLRAPRCVRTISVEEVLRKRGRLTENEAWALLCQTVQAIQDLFLNGKREEVYWRANCDEEEFSKRVQLTSKGRVILSPPSTNSNSSQPASKPPQSDTIIEKMLIEKVGKWLDRAVGPVSGRLRSVLDAMTSPDLYERASLMYLLDVITDQCSGSQHKPFFHVLVEIFHQVVGKDESQKLKMKSENKENTTDSDISPQSDRLDEACKKDCAKRKLYRKPVTANYCGPNTVIGPEFIVRSLQPSHRLHLLTNTKSVSMRRVLILLLSGKKIELSCNPNSTTFGQVFKLLVETEHIEYSGTLGLACLEGGDFIIPPLDTKICKLAPVGWLQRNNLNVNYTLYLRFRLYLPSLRGVSSWKWKHMLYLQLRKNLLDKVIQCTKNEMKALGGLALQAEFGDYDQTEHGMTYFKLEHYLPSGEECTVSELVTLHRGRRGMDPGKAEEMFISHLMYNPTYGTHHFTATPQNDNEPKGKLTVGVNSKGMVVCGGCGQTTFRNIFLWGEIKKLCYTKRSFEIVTTLEIRHKLKMEKNKSFYLFRLAWLHHKFFMKISNEFTSVQQLSEELGGLKHEADESLSSTVLYVESPEKKKHQEPGMLRRAATFLSPDKVIFRGKTSSHCGRSVSCREKRNSMSDKDFEANAFKTASASLPVLDGMSSGGRRRGVLMGTKVISNNPSLHDLTASTLQPAASLGNLHATRAKDLPGTVINHTKTLSTLRDPLTSKPHVSLNARSLNHTVAASREAVMSKESQVVKERNSAVLQSSSNSSKPTASLPRQFSLDTSPPITQAYVVNSSIKSVDDRYELDITESISESLAEKMDKIPFTNKRLLTTVSLKRSTSGSLGLQVTEGKDGGVYILSVLSGGPAYTSGKIFTGDQIQAVNGQSVLSLPYGEALKTVQSAGDLVDLVLSQVDRGQQVSKGNNKYIPHHSQGLDLLANVLQKPIEKSYMKVIRYDMESEPDHHMMISELPNLSYL